MRSVSVNEALDGNIASPDEVMEEVREVTSVAHSLDNHNFLGRLGNAKLAPDVFGSIMVEGRTTTQSVSHGTNSQPHDIYRVPDDAGADWNERYTSKEGCLKISYDQVIVNDDAGDPLFVAIGVRVDGAVVARSPQTRQTEHTASPHCETIVPVRAGEHVIEMIYWMHPGAVSLSAARIIDFETGVLKVREMAR